MNDKILCPYCKKQIPLTQALSHQLQEKYKVFYKKRLQEEKTKIEEELKKQLTKKIQEDTELKFKDKSNEAEELKKQNKAFQEQLLDLNKLIRQLRNENQNARVELEKKLAKEQERIRDEEKKRLNEEYGFKISEKEKKLTDALKVNAELKRKLEQGSQQTQGEVLELEMENMLKAEFPSDEIRPVPKGTRGADIIQIVNNNQGKSCGKIIWESKRTKTWSDSWISKLKEDQRQIHAELAVLISNILPEKIKGFGLINGIWIGSYESIIGLACALRSNLLEIALVKQASIGKKGKMEVLYNYLRGTDFKHRVEAIVESFTFMQEDIEKERRWFNAKWAKQERNIRKVIDNTSGMHGDLQSIMGRALEEIKGLNILPSGKADKKEDEKNSKLF